MMVMLVMMAVRARCGQARRAAQGGIVNVITPINRMSGGGRQASGVANKDAILNMRMQMMKAWVASIGGRAMNIQIRTAINRAINRDINVLEMTSKIYVHLPWVRSDRKGMHVLLPQRIIHNGRPANDTCAGHRIELVLYVVVVTKVVNAVVLFVLKTIFGMTCVV